MKEISNPIKINVLLCDTFPGRLPDDIPSYVSLHEELFRRVAPDVRFRVYMTMDGELPQSLNGDELYLVPGCICSAYDPLPWIESLQNWIRDAVAHHAFLVGICFGHQVIAQALGGEVSKYPGGWGTGIRESQILESSMLPFFPDGHMRLLYNHHDQVVTPPPGANTLATSDFCRYEGLRINDHVFTFQGHPEYTPYYMGYYLHNLAAEQDPLVVERALQSLELLSPQGTEVAKWIVEMFARYLENK